MDSTAGRFKGANEEIISFTAYLDDLQSKVYQAHRLLTKADELITTETIRNKFLGKAEKPRSFIGVFHYRKVEALIGKEFNKGTLCCYKTSLQYYRNL